MCSRLTCCVASKESESRFVCLGAGSSSVDPPFYPFCSVHTAENTLVGELPPRNRENSCVGIMGSDLPFIYVELFAEFTALERCGKVWVLQWIASKAGHCCAHPNQQWAVALLSLYASGAVRREECHRLQASFCDLKWHVIVAWVQKKLRSDVSKIPSHKTYPATSSYSRQNPALL